MSQELPAALNGERVDRVVAVLTGCTRSEAARLVLQGAVRRNNHVVGKGSDRVAQGDLFEVDLGQLGVAEVAESDHQVEVQVVFEDDDVIVVNKPPGIVVHPGAGVIGGTLVNGLLARYPALIKIGEPERPGIVHRLDKFTSGLLVVARSDSAYRSLKKQLYDRSVERLYQAVVWGHLKNGRGVIDAAIARSRRQRKKMTVAESGREARTHYFVQRRMVEPAAVTLVKCRLETGRTHQIRVHFEAIGHPVVGDAVYGGIRDSLEFGRQALHAGLIGFEHPATGKRVRFEAELPRDFAGLLSSLS